MENRGEEFSYFQGIHVKILNVYWHHHFHKDYDYQIWTAATFVGVDN